MCHVRWLHTYTEGHQPRPVYVETTEVSVYDLSDHPDFGYRPGDTVIWVAGKQTGLGAGQVVDVNTDGEVIVRWASQDGKEEIFTPCWPQDRAGAS